MRYIVFGGFLFLGCAVVIAGGMISNNPYWKYVLVPMGVGLLVSVFGLFYDDADIGGDEEEKDEKSEGAKEEQKEEIINS